MYDHPIRVFPVSFLLLLGALLGAGVAQAHQVPDEEDLARQLQQATPDTLKLSSSEAQASGYLRQALEGEGGESGARAARAYRRLLGTVGPGLSAAKKEALAAPLARLAPMLPERLKREVLAAGEWKGAPSEWRFAEDAGAKVMAWWRSQDPLPATEANERLHEHLRRVAFALKNYGYDQRPAGFDDRGAVYVKYGRPKRIRKVEQHDPGRVPWYLGPGRQIMIPNLNKAFMDVFGISLASFPPENEVWFYDQVSEDAYYIFVESEGEGKPYLAGEVKDLLPPALQRGIFGRYGKTPGSDAFVSGGGWNRATRRTFAAYQAKRSIYQQLSSAHADFSTRYAGMLQAASDASVGKPSINKHMASRNRLDEMKDWRARRQREEVMPAERTSLLDGVGRLAVAYRTARFLGQDGTTRAEVYWAPAPGALSFGEEAQANLAALGYPAPRRYLLAGHVRAYDRVYQNDAARTTRRLLEPQEAGPGQTVPTQTFAVSGLSGLFHLSMQFEQRLLRSSSSGAAPGPRVRLTTVRADSMAALAPESGGLAMSDLRPMLLPPHLIGALPVGKALRSATRRLAYPFDKILPSAPLALYFEVYHLAFGTEDRTRYTVEYEVYRRSEAGGLRGLFGRDEEQRTATEATYVSTRRTAHEVILLDLSDAQVQSGSELVVTVRVTDEVTKKTQERSVAFEVIGAEGES